MQPGITIDVTGASGASNGTSIYLQVG